MSGGQFGIVVAVLAAALRKMGSEPPMCLSKSAITSRSSSSVLAFWMMPVYCFGLS
jgi:hypothetical protein